MKTLIAEDDLTSRAIAHRLLGRLGPCDAVENGVDAVAAFTRACDEDQPYDLVCLDIMMPEMDGLQALKQIRALEHLRGISDSREVKVIMLTALDDPRSVVEAFYRCGATAYLVKPLDADKLMSELRQLGLIPMADDPATGRAPAQTARG